MPFPKLRMFGAADSGRGGRRRGRRAQQREQGEDYTPPESPSVAVEKRKQKIGFGVGAFLLLIIAGVVVFGYYKEFYAPPRVWAGSVSDTEFTMGDLVSRIRVLQGVNRYQGGQVNLSTVPFEYLQDLVNAEILRQQSPVLGIAIDDEDIQTELRRQFSSSADVGQETDPGQLDQEFRQAYSSYLTATGLSDGDFKVIVKEQLSLRGLAALLSRGIDEEQAHVEVQWIQIPVDGDILIDEVEDRLENEDFTRIAQELNAPSQFTDGNGYVGWVPKGAFPELDETLFGNEAKGIPAQAPGTISSSIYTSDSYYLIRTLSASEDRTLNNLMGSKLLEESVSKWQREALLSGTKAGTVRMNFNSRLYEWVTDQVFITAPRIERPTPVPDPNQIPGLGQ